MFIFYGVACTISTPIAGAIYDFTGNYDASIYLAGVSLVVASALSLVAQILHRSKKIVPGEVLILLRIATKQS